jgi:hypothetical protein
LAEGQTSNQKLIGEDWQQQSVPGLVVRLRLLSCVGMGSIPIQVASKYEGMSSLYTLVQGSGPICYVYKIMFETVQNFFIMFLEFA